MEIYHWSLLGLSFFDLCCSLCELYNWRYKKLGNLPHIHIWREYRFANAGFFYDFQLIDVGDFNGVGESEPNPYFYQVTMAYRGQTGGSDNLFCMSRTSR